MPPTDPHPPAADCHAHVFSRDAAAIPGARYRPAYEATVEAWQRGWKAAGVTHGVLVQPSFFGSDNRELLAALARDREHLCGVAVVEAHATDAELVRLRAAGVCGLRWNLKGVPSYAPYASEAWRALLGRAHALGLHLEVFVDHGRLAELLPALEGTPIDVVLDHFGNPGLPGRGLESTFKAAERLAEDRALWIKFSAEYRLGGADAKLLAIRWLRFSPDRVVWGSDWPWTGHEAGREYGAVRAELASWAEPGRLRAILWDNAGRLYGFDAPKGTPRLA